MYAPKINDHVIRALARILEQYKSAPRLKGILTGLTDQIQDLEDTFDSIRAARGIATAYGEQLDALGRLVGVERPDDVSDDVYRVIIYGKAAANSSSGETESVINAYMLLTQATNVRLEEEFPAKINIFSNGTISIEAQKYVEYYLKLAMPAGVLLGTFGLVSSDAGFGFAENPNAAGFGDLNDPTVGGGLGSLLG